MYNVLENWFVTENSDAKPVIGFFTQKYMTISNCNLLCSEIFYKFGNFLPGMHRKVNISMLMVFRNQRRTNYPRWQSKEPLYVADTLLERLHLRKLASCYRFSCYYRFSDIAINSVNPSFIWRLEFSKNGYVVWFG
jgi:hypothetical protein